MLRSLSAAVLALAFCACEPNLPQVTPAPTVTAVFDPAAAKIPLPNDLVFIAPINTVCPAPSNGFIAPTDPPKCAQAELIATFRGKFPSDQELPLTIDFTENTYENGRLKLIAPALDLSTITPATLLVVGATGPVPLETPTAADYVVGTNADGTPADHGTLTVHHKDHLPWATGGYTLVMRGGDMGVKTKDSIPVTPSPVFDLVEQGKDMTLPENLGLLKAQNNGSTVDALAQGQQLNLLIGIYKTTAFPAADNVGKFPHTEMAIASTFQIDTTVTNVTVDPARGLAPLPFDLLRDPTSHKLTATAACGFLGTPLDKTGACPNPAAAGFLALDGFSTTGAILAPTSGLINAGTVNATSLRLFDLSTPSAPVQVDPTSLIVEPCEFTSDFNIVTTTCTPSATRLSPVIAFQPAGATTDPADGGSSLFRTRPLKDSTDYAVVVTTDVKDLAGKAIGPGTVAKILRFTNPLFVGGHSALLGIDDATALSLDNMRKQLIPVFTKLGPTDAAKVAMAYTFHTQSVLTPAVQLGAFPYNLPASTALPNKLPALAAGPAAGAFTKYGVPTNLSLHIAEVIEVDITTFNLLDPATGAFLADTKMAAGEPIHVLIATPQSGVVPPCPGDPNPLKNFKCSPMMVFRHGLGRGRADMLLIADTFAAAGMTTVAIDAAKHGDRSLCLSAAPSPQNGCVGTCTPIPMAAGQGDTAATGGPPGTCDIPSGQTSGLIKAPVTPGATDNTDGIARASGNYLISANFFRTRDSLRQDVIDQSQLVRAIAFRPTAVVPTGVDPQTGNAVFDHMAQTGVVIDPDTIYFSGQSLGAIQGTLDVATNPRISKAGLNVGGGTLVDIFSNSPTFKPLFGQLLAGLGINPVTNPQQYLQFLTVAKTILDPADPANFAGHLTAHTLPDLLTNPNGQVPQAAKQVLIQVANCDQVVPNPFGLVWSSNAAFATAVPQGPLPNNPAFFAPGSTGNFQLFVGKDFNPLDFGNPTKCTDTTAAGALANGGGHGFLLSFEHADLSAAAQGSLAAFMMAGTLPNSFVRAQ
jgi:hypothetical protein